MLGKDAILELILEECDICLHLFGKIPAGTLDFRPTEDQRSMLELLRYVSYCAIGGTRAMAEGDWEGYKEVAGRAAEMSADEFPAAMERQKDELRAYFGSLSQSDVETRTATSPMGDEMSLERALVLLPLKWIVGYRMQLFLYAKQAGNQDIWTPNCWAGADAERPAPVGVPDDA